MKRPCANSVAVCAGPFVSTSFTKTESAQLNEPLVIHILYFFFCKPEFFTVNLEIMLS